MRANRILDVAKLSRRPLAAMLLAMTMMPLAAGPATSVQAKAPAAQDAAVPSARVQVIIKRVIVHDDMDWGNGEVKVRARIRTNDRFCSTDEGDDCGHTLIEASLPQFSATDGWKQTENRTIPAAGDSISEDGSSPELGIGIFPGQWYGLRINGTEVDTFSDDSMGYFWASITNEQGQVLYGSHTQRTEASCEYHAPFGSDFCAPRDLDKPATGAISVEYEIVKAPLPDLRAAGVTVSTIPGDTAKRVCVGVQNAEIGTAGPFETTFKIDGVVPSNGRIPWGGLAPGGSANLCIAAEIRSSGQHQVSAVVDEANAIAEFSETNNTAVQPYIASRVGTYEGPMTGPGSTASDESDEADPSDETDEADESESSQKDEPPVFTPRATPSPAPSSTPAQSARRADVSVEAIKVNGQVPDGKNDCTGGNNGKNTVAVVVKYLGSESAGDVPVRLVVDGNPVGERSVDGLKAGQQREVRFDGVRLSTGEHKLFASINGKADLTTDEHNSRTVTAACGKGN
jgi:hypothetical protein